jgi:hypothetical protein
VSFYPRIPGKCWLPHRCAILLKGGSMTSIPDF